MYVFALFTFVSRFTVPGNIISNGTSEAAQQGVRNIVVYDARGTQRRGEAELKRRWTAQCVNAETSRTGGARTTSSRVRYIESKDIHAVPNRSAGDSDPLTEGHLPS